MCDVYGGVLWCGSMWCSVVQCGETLYILFGVVWFEWCGVACCCVVGVA